MRHEVSSLSVLYGLHYLSHIGIPDDDKESRDSIVFENLVCLVLIEVGMCINICKSRDLFMIRKTKKYFLPDKSVLWFMFVVSLHCPPSWCDIKVK